ncbi:hypothetical protein [Caballeronia sp. LjRoot31]|uniref:hypothetical protein n=1 Tax=Caballeronia sp. LjRoot31 TaxID=3342324 RepID=UPI003ED08532
MENLKNLTNTMICWKPGGDVKLMAHPCRPRGASRGWRAVGACDSEYHEATPEQRKTMIFIEAVHLIVRDGCDPQTVHAALCGLEEYRDGLSYDMPRPQQDRQTASTDRDGRD